MFHDDEIQFENDKLCIDFPLRMALNSAVLGQCPSRIIQDTHNYLYYQHIYSTEAISRVMANNSHNSINFNSSAVSTNTKSLYFDAQTTTQIADLRSAAIAGLRTNKKDIEAISSVSLGIIYDNIGDYESAIQEYTKYAELCDLLHDKLGKSAALNYLGVSYMLLGTKVSDTGMNPIPCIGNNKDTTLENIQQAIKFHQMHVQNSNNDVEKFIALINLGLCFSILQEFTESNQYYQDALKLSINIKSIFGQSIAVGNLGLNGFKQDDFKSAKLCFEQNLQLVQMLIDFEMEIFCYIMVSYPIHFYKN